MVTGAITTTSTHTIIFPSSEINYERLNSIYLNLKYIYILCDTEYTI